MLEKLTAARAVDFTTSGMVEHFKVKPISVDYYDD